MTNKEIAESIRSGKKSSHRAKDLREATAIRVAAHRLGLVLTVQREKAGWRLTKSTSRVSRRKPAKKAAKKR